MSLNILFISHEATATGAPIFLLNFAKWLKQNIPHVSIATIIIKNGQMYDDWCHLGPVALVEGLHDKILLETVKRFYRDNRRFDVAYFNTVESSHLLALFAEQNWFGDSVQTILHAHELEGTIQKYGADRLHKIRNYPDKIFAASAAVKKNLIEKHGFIPSDVQTIHPCARDLSESTERKINKTNNQKIVLGCGEIAVVKGTDLFIQTCKNIAKKSPVLFQWLGANLQGVLPYLKNDIKKLNLENHMSFVGHHRDVCPWFSQADIFFLSSREDSCPLVCLEAASLGLPIVYFEQSGGMDEVLGSKAGFPVPYMDIEAAAATILHILHHPEEGLERGRVARELYERHYKPSVVYSSLFNHIKNLISENEVCLL